jgi:hypothetical protein
MWWLLLLLLIPLAWWLFQIVVGATMPASESGRFYLRTLLKNAGVLQLVPDECVRELVEHEIEIATMMSKLSREGMKTEMVNRLDGAATIIVVWITGQPWPFKEDDFVPRTLLKYGVQRGALKQHA